ncbi:MAG TPA: hypothetical protein VFN67_13360 [Polyangiales bacterium]|nr:hypothetical protein [Polyangiales bacterium]
MTEGGNVPPAAAGMPPDAGAAAPVRSAASSGSAGTKPQMSTAPVVDMSAMDDDAGSGMEPLLLAPTKLPTVDGKCPDMKGNGTHMFSAGGRSLMVDIFMRPDAKSMPAPGGPLVLYFHALDADSKQVTTAVGQAAIDRVVAQGGVVASFNAVPCLRCGLADDVVWYDEDDVVSDQVVACAIEKAQIDTRRIHTVGFSSGALHTMHLALARSNYIASVVSFSGGVPATPNGPRDPTNKVPALLSFGREGVDNAVVDFNVSSHDWYNTYVPQGYYVMMCAHGRGHEIPPVLPDHVLRFLLDHPYRVDPEPYKTMIPSEFPTYCTNSP